MKTTLKKYGNLIVKYKLIPFKPDTESANKGTIVEKNGKRYLQIFDSSILPYEIS